MKRLGDFKRLLRFLPLVTVAAVAAIMALRNPVALFRAEFWAEDGTEFLRTALNSGPSAIWLPVTGYYLPLQRIIAYFASFFPVIWWPTLYAAVSGALGAYILAYFSRPGFAWIVPSFKLRFGICMLLVIGPGTAEVFFNLSNLHTIVSLFIILLLLEEPRGAPSSARIGTLTLLTICTPQAVVLVPLFVLLGMIRARRYLLPLVALIPFVLANVLANHQMSTVAPDSVNYSNLLEVPSLRIENLFTRFFYAPFLGAGLTEYFMTTRALLFWPITLLLAAGAAWAAYRSHWERRKALLLGTAAACALATIGIVAVARAYNLPLIRRSSGNLLWDMRYSFLPGATALLFWSGLLFDRQSTFTRAKPVTALILGLLFTQSITHWRQIPSRPPVGWEKVAGQIQEAVDLRNAGKLKNAVEVPGVGLQPNAYASIAVRIEPH